MSSINFSLGVYLSITTRLLIVTVITIDFAQSQACNIHLNSIAQVFNFEFKRANKPGFEPRSPGPKETMLTIELHVIDTCILFIVKMHFDVAI